MRVRVPILAAALLLALALPAAAREKLPVVQEATAASTAARAKLQASLGKRIEALKATGDLYPDQLKRITFGVQNGTLEDLKQISRALHHAETTRPVRRGVVKTAPKDYLHPGRAERRLLVLCGGDRCDEDVPAAPQPLGVFQPQLWQGIDPTGRARALGIQRGPGGRISAAGGARNGSALVKTIEKKRPVVARKVPSYLPALLPSLYGAEDAARLNAKLDRLLENDANGSHRLHAEKATLLYPETEITPAGAPRYRETLESLLASDDIAFVFSQTYEFTDKKLLELFRDVSKRAPTYAIIGEVADNHPVHDLWAPGRGGQVKWVRSHIDAQGKSREFRIDHNKNLMIVKKDGSVFIFKTGINNNTYSSQNIDIAVMLQGGNVALDALGHMIRDYLRAGGDLDPADLAKLKPALTKMINYRPGAQAIPVETAISSSTSVGNPRGFTLPKLERALGGAGEITMSAGTLRKMIRQKPTIVDQIANAARKGKRVVVLDEGGGDLADVSGTLTGAGVEIVKPGTIYMDNSLESMTHRFIDQAAASGERIVHAAFADSDGKLARRIIKASESTQVDEVFSRLVIQGRDINAGNATRYLWNERFGGTVTGIAQVPGPLDERGVGRKFHMKALAAYRPAKGGTPESGRVLIKSANDSVHGMRVNEESGFLISSPSLAKELMSFMDEAARRYGTKLSAPLPATKTRLEDRQSVTRRIPGKSTKLRDLIFLMGDWETSGFSAETDARPTEIAFKMYTLNPQGDGLMEVKPGKLKGLPVDFHRRVNLGRDHYGEEMQLSPEVAEITGLSQPMLAYEPGPVEAMNELNRWIRLVEERTGKVVIFGGHNMAAFDRRMHNDFNRFEGVDGNPVQDGETLDTLVGLRSLEPNYQGTRKLFPTTQRWAKRVGQKLDASEAHHAYDDTVMAATLASMQLGHLAKKLGPLRDKTWGDIREYFVPNKELERAGKAETAFGELGEQ